MSDLVMPLLRLPRRLLSGPIRFVAAFFARIAIKVASLLRMRCRLLSGRILFMVVFFAMLAVNSLATFSGWQYPTTFDENRRLASPPVWQRSVSQFFRDTDAYITDHFAFRQFLLQNFNAFLFYKLHSSLSPRVVLGEDGWIFGAAFDRPGEFGPRQWPTDYLDAARLSFVERRDWLRERGATLLLAFFPTKEAVYVDKLPSYLRDDAAQPWASEQLYRRLGPELADLFVPIREEMQRRSNQYDTYYRTDSHANGMGSLTMLEEILGHIQRHTPDKAPGPYPSYETVPDRLFPTAYGRLMGVPIEEITQVPVTRDGAFQTSEMPPELAAMLPEQAFARRRRNDRRNGHVVLLGDSFTNRLAPLLAQMFGTVDSINMNRLTTADPGSFPNAFLEAVHPDLVIISYVDSRLAPCASVCTDLVPLINTEAVRQARLRRLYEAAGEVPADGRTAFVLARFHNRGAVPATLRRSPITTGPLALEADSVTIPPGRDGYLFLTADAAIRPAAVAVDGVPESAILRETRSVDRAAVVGTAAMRE